MSLPRWLASGRSRWRTCLTCPSGSAGITRPRATPTAPAASVPLHSSPAPGRALLARYDRPLHQAFARFDGLLDRVREAGGPYVITHGEPHPGNLLRTRAGLCLVDWDMTALARP